MVKHMVPRVAHCANGAEPGHLGRYTIPRVAHCSTGGKQAPSGQPAGRL